MSNLSNQPLLKIAGKSPPMGSEAASAERWRNQWKTLQEAITKTEAQIQDHKSQIQKEWQELGKPPTLSQEEKEELGRALRLILDPPPSSVDIMALGKAMTLFTESPLVDPKTEKAEEVDDVLQRYYIPAAIDKQRVLLDKLCAFSGTVLSFFYNGFYPDQISLEPLAVQEKPEQMADERSCVQPSLTQLANALFFASAQYSPNYVLGSVLEQTSLDLTIIHQAFHQRQIPTLCAKLFAADNFARMALKPAIASGFLGMRAPDVTCYLNKAVEIRLLPYHEMVLIGIPFTADIVLGKDILELSSAAYVSTDYLAIPHEIGHYLYQYGQAPASFAQTSPHPLAKRPLAKIVQGQLQDKLAKQPDRLQRSTWIYTWLEEIFADAYGCLVAGPVSVLGFLQVLADGLPSALQEQSDKHPLAVLRPLIQTQILRTIQNPFGEPLYRAEADQLDAHWQQWVKTHWSQWVDLHWPYGYGNQTDILRAATYEIAGQSLTGQQILEELQAAIDVILDILSCLQPKEMASTWTPKWDAESCPDAQKINGLFDHFKHFAVMEWFVSFADILSIEDVAANQAPVPFPWSTAHLDDLQGQRFVKPGFDTLVEALLFEGWSTEGPRAGHVH